MIRMLLSHPKVFDVQQNFCNTYDNVRAHWSRYLTRDNLNILDVGCSTGIGASKIFDFEKNKYLGIDLSDKYLEFASKKYANAAFRKIDATKMELDSNSMDIVNYLGVLHHINDDIAKKCLQESLRVLKPDGYLLISEPVFTPNKLISNVFLSLDRGKYIRESSEYLGLLGDCKVLEIDYINFSLHRFFSIVAQKNNLL